MAGGEGDGSALPCEGAAVVLQRRNRWRDCGSRRSRTRSAVGVGLAPGKVMVMAIRAGTGPEPGATPSQAAQGRQCRVSRAPELSVKEPLRIKGNVT